MVSRLNLKVARGKLLAKPPCGAVARHREASVLKRNVAYGRTGPDLLQVPRFPPRCSSQQGPRGGCGSVALPLHESGCGIRFFQATNADTSCDVSVGTPATVFNQNHPCYQACTERHEGVHRRDIAPCCRKENAAYKAAKSDEKRASVQDKFNDWGEKNVDWLECRAYAESARCGNEFLAKNCKSPAAESLSPEVSADIESSAVVTVVPFEGSGGADEPDASEPGRQAQETDSLAEDDQLDVESRPEMCCAEGKRYTRVSEARRDTVCGRAGRALTPCPF